MPATQIDVQKARVALELVRTFLLADIDQLIRQDLAIAKKRLAAELEGADFFRGYTLNVVAGTQAQTFKMDKITIPVKLAALTIVTPSGGNPADTFSFQISDPNNNPEYLDVPVQNLPVGQVDAKLKFRRPHPIPAFSTISAVWTNAVSASKVVIVGAAYIRNQGAIDTATN